MGLATVIIKKDGTIEPAGHVVDVKPPFPQKISLTVSFSIAYFRYTLKPQDSGGTQK